jgi:hypothetical protein
VSRWFALFLLACGARASPVANATIAPPVVTAPVVPAVPFRGIEHPRFVAMDAGPLWIFGAHLTSFPTPQLPLGGTLRVHFATCEFDETRGVERGRCQSVTRAAFEKIDWKGSASPLEWKFWAWARDRMTIVDAPVDQTVAQRYALAHAGRGPHLGSELVVASEKATTLIDEKILVAGGAEALPFTRATGKKVKHTVHTGTLVYDTAPLPSVVLPDEYPLVASLFGSGASAFGYARFIIVSSDGPRDAITDALEDAYKYESHRAETLAMLEASEQDDHDVRIALDVDRAIIAWWLRDADALRRATKSLDAELTHGDPADLEVKIALGQILPSLRQLRDDANISVVMPAGLETWR